MFTLWSLIPAVLTATWVADRAFGPASVALAITIVWCAVGVRLTQQPSRRAIAVALGLTAVVWCPSVLQLIRRTAVVHGVGSASVADNPVGFLVGAAVEGLFFILPSTVFLLWLLRALVQKRPA